MLNKRIAVSLYHNMLRIRMAEETILNLYPEQEMRCPIHLCIGQEAIPAGVCANLRKEDYIMSNHRSHGHYLAKGGDMKAMFAEIYGKSTGCTKGKGGSMHLVDLSVNMLGATSIVAGVIPVACGVAWHDNEKREKDNGSFLWRGCYGRRGLWGNAEFCFIEKVTHNICM